MHAICNRCTVWIHGRYIPCKPLQIWCGKYFITKLLCCAIKYPTTTRQLSKSLKTNESRYGWQHFQVCMGLDYQFFQRFLKSRKYDWDMSRTRCWQFKEFNTTQPVGTNTFEHVQSVLWNRAMKCKCFERSNCTWFRGYVFVVIQHKTTVQLDKNFLQAGETDGSLLEQETWHSLTYRCSIES